MAKLSKKKRTILLVAILSVIALGVIGFFLFRQATSPPTTPEQSLENVPDYGACELITTDVVKSARKGDQITNISEGTRKGTDGLNGQKSDACSFNFTTTQSSSNSLIVSVYPYNASEDQFNQEAEAAQWSEVSGPKPTPYFGKTMVDDNKTSVYMLRVIPGAKTVLLTLRQPENAKTYNEADAVNLLVDISNKINFGALERNAEQQAEADTEGDGPGTPPTNQPNIEAKPRE